MKHLKLFNNSGERFDEQIKPYKERPVVTFTDDESKGLDFYRKSKRIATFEATDDNKLCVNSLKGFAKFIVDGEDILPKDFLDSGQWESFIVDETTFDVDNLQYNGNGFLNEIYGGVKITCEVDITDDMLLYGLQMVGSGGMELGYNRVSELIYNGSIVRLDNKTLFYKEYYIEYFKFLGGVFYFVIFDENNENVIPTKNSAYTFKTKEVGTTSFVNTSNSLELSDDLQTALHAENMVHGIPSSWVIYPDAESISKLNKEPIFCVVLGTMALPIPFSEVLQEGLISGTEESINVNKILFTLLNGQTGLMDFGIYLLDQDTLSVVSAYNEVSIATGGEIFEEPYYFETNGIHEVEMDIIDGNNFMFLDINSLVEFGYFDKSCVTKFSDDMFDEIGISPICDVNQLSEITIPVYESNSYSSLLKSIKSLEKINTKNGSRYKAYGDGKYVTESGKLSICIDKSNTIKIPSGIKAVDLYAFDYNNNINEINFNETKEVSSSANLQSLTAITSTIEKFDGNITAPLLVKFNNLATDIDIDHNKLLSCKDIKFYGNATSDGKCLLNVNGVIKYFSDKSATTYSIEDGVVGIGDNTFNSCKTLTNVKLPSSLTHIGSRAFYDCENLGFITIPYNLKKIGSRAFAYCYKLSSVAMPKGVTEIGDNAFYCCYTLTSIIIPDSISVINPETFMLCSGMTNITISKNVKSIGYRAFYSCKSLAHIKCESFIAPEVHDEAFYSTKTNGVLTVPIGSDYSSWLSKLPSGWTIEYV